VAQRDPAKAIKDALAGHFDDSATTVTLWLDQDYSPRDGQPVVLVADDGGEQVTGGPWMAGRDMLRITLRLTVFAHGRSEARATLAEAVEYVLANRPAGIARIENVPAVLDTRDRETGAALASLTMPVVVRPITATNEE